MKDDKYKRVEKMLRRYPDIKVKIENLRLELEETQEIVGIRGASGNEKAGSATYAFSSSVENEVIERERNLDKRMQSILKEIQWKEREIKKVENALSRLSEKDMLLVEFRYFKDYSINRVCDLLDMTPATFNRRRKRIVAVKLMPLLMI